MPYKVGVSTGLYTVARAEELSDILRKLGFALTRGTNVIELTADIPHEVNISAGIELMHIAEKQGIELTLHGSLTVPLEIPERGEWRDAEDHIKKSIRSAVFSGCKYVNFHICLNIWLELMTYAGRKLTMVFCDHDGKFISEVLKKDEKLRKWFIQERGDIYLRDIVKRDEMVEMQSKTTIEEERWRKKETAERLRVLLEKELPPQSDPAWQHLRTAREDYIDARVTHALTTGMPPDTYWTNVNKKIAEMFDKLRQDTITKNVEIYKKITDETLDEHLAKGKDWESEELRGVVGVIDGYHIMAHHLFYTKDPIWVEMAKMYSDVVVDKYKINYDDDKWLDDAWKKAEKEADRKFKEFFYAACGAKFLEGHCKNMLNWMDDDLIKEIKALKISETDKNKILKAAKEIKIVFESPDARDPSHAGLFILWSPKQQYAAIKTVRQTLKTNRIWMLMDFEHVATQGIDPIRDMAEVVKIAPDFGKYVFSMHCNPPNPLHSMDPIELGDIRVYKLLWFLRETGFGRDETTRYLIFERGGAKDPFERSVEVLKLCVKYLEMDMPPDQLPPEFFGVEGPTAGGIARQSQIVKDHAWEPLKDLLEMPEEEWTFLSQTAIRKGKRPEVWKKAEFR